jgi:hypothetical protein
MRPIASFNIVALDKKQIIIEKKNALRILQEISNQT